MRSVIPGFLIALLLRFDATRASAEPSHGAHGSFAKPYFTAAMVAYVAGLAATVAVMEFFKAAQPALLYLVPCCLGATLLTGLVRGELSALFAYDEEVKEETSKDSTAGEGVISEEPKKEK